MGFYPFCRLRVNPISVTIQMKTSSTFRWCCNSLFIRLSREARERSKALTCEEWSAHGRVRREKTTFCFPYNEFVLTRGRNMSETISSPQLLPSLTRLFHTRSNRPFARGPRFYGPTQKIRLYAVCYTL